MNEIQLVEERIDDSPSGSFTPDRASQQFWGLRYIDDAVMKWVDDTLAEGTGTENEWFGGAYATKNGYTADAYFYITNHQFSVVALLDAAGALVERISYDAYGNARHHYRDDIDGDGDFDTDDYYAFVYAELGTSPYFAEGDLNRDGAITHQDYVPYGSWRTAVPTGRLTGATGVHNADNRFGYCGYRYDPDQNLYHVRHRVYDQTQGRWLQRDPAGYVDGENLYGYVTGSPVTYSDPTGLFSIPQLLRKVLPDQGCYTEYLELNDLIEKPLRDLLKVTPMTRGLGRPLTGLLRSKLDIRAEFEGCITEGCPPCLNFRATMIGEFNLLPTINNPVLNVRFGTLAEAGGTMQCCPANISGLHNCDGELYVCAGIFLDANYDFGFSRGGFAGQAKACVFLPSGEWIVTGNLGGYYEVLNWWTGRWRRIGIGKSWCYDGGSGRCNRGGPAVAF